MVVVAEPGGDVGGVSDKKKKAVVVGEARILKGGESREEGEYGGGSGISVLGGLVRDPKGGKKEEYRVVSIKKTGILKKVRRGIGAWKEAVMVIVVVDVVVVVVMEDRDP